MPDKLVIHTEKITDASRIIGLCPFDAIEFQRDHYAINAACKMCRLCETNGPPGVFEFVEDEQVTSDTSQWRGIAVYAEHSEGNLHPVTLELLGKAQELTAKNHQPIFVLLIGHKLGSLVETLSAYGVDEIVQFDHPQLDGFRIEPYAAAFEAFIRQTKPAVVLVGATPIGRSLAPRMAARFRTGLTADCTELEMQPEGELVQIRPAFGGNIMARIATPHHRPQFATVRYKVMREAAPLPNPALKIRLMQIAESLLDSKIQILQAVRRGRETDITEATVLVVAGRGIANAKDLAMVQALTDALGGQLAATRPMVEKGWLEAKRHVGLSGRTVKPNLLITCGVSGAIQFTAGIMNSECIFAINNDPDAPIFQVANYGVVGDLYEVIPPLTERLLSTRRSPT